MSQDDTMTMTNEIHDAETQPYVLIEKPWGREVIFADGSAGYVGKMITVLPNQQLSLQYHLQKVETMHFIAGGGEVDMADRPGDTLTPVPVTIGTTVHIPAGKVHRVRAGSMGLTFAEVSTAYPGWETDIVRLFDLYGREGTTAQ